MRIWLFLLGYIAILFTSSILFREVEFKLVRLGLTYGAVLIYILFIVSSHNMLIGLRPNSRVFNLSFLVPILILTAVANLYSISWSDFLNLKITLILGVFLVLFIQCTSEELIFRGVIFRYFLANRNRLLHSAILSSVMFSIFHLMSLTKTQDLTVVGSQMIVSFLLGLFLVGIYCLSQNILISVLAHMILNFTAYVNRIAVENAMEAEAITSSHGIEWTQILAATIFYLPYGIIGIILILKSRNDLKWI